MTVNDIVKLYQSHPQILQFGQALLKKKQSKFGIQGLVGSQEAFWISALYRNLKRNLIIILNDKEEALYFVNDLKTLMPQKEIFFFPASYKRPYQIEEIENANVLLRAEVLNAMNHVKSGRQIIVTFAEALNEKVINKRSLVKNTLEIRKGDDYGMDFVVEILDEYGFEGAEVVYEPGQYAMRGGLLDVFSFAHDEPFRIEFFGDEIESIRTFDPVEQISQKQVKRVSLIPNIQKHLLLDERVSFLEYISDSSIVFTKSIEFIHADLSRLYEKSEAYYLKMHEASGGAVISREPHELYFSGEGFLEEIKDFQVVEFGRNQYFEAEAFTIRWEGNGQPSFRKEFSLLAEHLIENQGNGIQNLVLSNNEKQIQRLEEIFEEVNPHVAFQGILSDIHKGFSDPQLQIACYTDHQIFDRYHRYKVKSNTKRSQALTLKELLQLKPRDYVIHVNHGIGLYAGLHKIKVGQHWQEAVKIIYKGGDEIYVNVNSLHKISKYSGGDVSSPPKLNKLGSPAWSKAKAKAKARIKTLAFNLVELYAKRKLQRGFAFSPDTYLQQELEASFMYEDTPDQLKATEAVKEDMEKIIPMDRLICGDVGFGKTEIAIRAAFKAAVDGKQTAILVPTTILALQHYHTFHERLKQFPVEVDFINRFKSRQEQKKTLEKVAAGKTDILIGTHRIVSKDVKFKDLGLLVLDEEQKFGVNVKEKLKLLKSSVDTLTLTATPIPRTLQFSLMNIRDLSVIATPPPNRQPVETRVITLSQEIIRDAIVYELKRGGQVFFIHPRVMDIEKLAAMIKKLVPDARVKVGHGQMTGPQLEKVMADFIEGYFDVLVATTIVESGLDIPNANTIIINEANKFGLSALHQMRGRVGRSNRKAFCYLLAPPEIVLSKDAKRRLRAMEEFSDLGSGFHIALRDLDIRGAGDLLGAEQSGFIAEIGYDMYHKILDEAIHELKKDHFAELFDEELKEREAILVDDCQIDMDLELRIPEHYIPGISERLTFYRRIANEKDEKGLRAIKKEILDRFGRPMPKPVLGLFDATLIREYAKRIGVERVVLKAKRLRLCFVSNKSSHFYESPKFMRIIAFVQSNPRRVELKESNKYLSLAFRNVSHIKAVLKIVKEVHDFVAAPVGV